MKTFSIGGIHVPDCKISSNNPIETPHALPKQVVMMLSQNIGAPSVPIVKKGDYVKVGTKIASAGGFMGSNLHSSVSGVVNKIDLAVDSTGYKKPAIFIDVQQDEWEEGIDNTQLYKPIDNISPEEIIEKIKEAGIVGMGGACFPTHVKLSPPKEYTPEYLIVNGVECEPYLTADDRLMVECPKYIVLGMKLIQKALKLKKCFIGIESNKGEAISILRDETELMEDIEVVPLQKRYPQGGEKQLIDAVLHRKVQSGKLPVSEGVIVENVGTVYAIYQAVMNNRPLIDRIVTLTGYGVSRLCNLKVRIGTPVRDVIEMAWGLTQDAGKIILGGPMMGKAISNLDIPICKGTSGILVLTEEEAQRKQPSPCIRCAKCVRACPMGLEPYLLSALSERKEYDQCEKEGIANCIECGCCSYTCPANRPLLDYVRMGKSRVMANIRARVKATSAK